MPSCGVCLSPSVSVTFVFGVAVSKHILKLFTIWQAIVPVVFLHQTLWQFWRGPLAILGVLKAYVYEINCDFRPISRFLSEMIQDRAFYVNVNLYSASSQKSASNGKAYGTSIRTRRSMPLCDLSNGVISVTLSDGTKQRAASLRQLSSLSCYVPIFWPTFTPLYSFQNRTAATLCVANATSFALGRYIFELELCEREVAVLDLRLTKLASCLNQRRPRK